MLYILSDYPKRSYVLVRTNAADKIISQTLRNEGVVACINLLARYVRLFLWTVAIHRDTVASTVTLRYAISLPDEKHRQYILS